jgi:hypothetical protein
MAVPTSASSLGYHPFPGCSSGAFVPVGSGCFELDPTAATARLLRTGVVRCSP